MSANESPPDGHQLVLDDPDDYHRAQRLKAIHDARQRVNEVLDEINTYTTTKEHEGQKGDLALAVSAYGMEILPSLNDSGINFDTTLPEGFPWKSLGEYVDELGGRGKGDIPYNTHTLVFQRFNEALEQIEPLLKEDESGAATFDYSDLLDDD